MPSVIVARLHSLEGDDEGREHRNKYGQGVSPVYDRAGQVAEIRFTEFSDPTVASQWLDSHGYVGYELSEQSVPNNEKHRHFLALEFTPQGPDLIEKDGGLLVMGVKLLAAGTWTDSVQKTPCRYTPQKLEKYATNWTDRTFWSRHAGGMPRDATDVIGEPINLRFADDAVVADLWYDGITDKSRNCIAIVKAAAAGKRKAPFVSVEMWTRDVWIAAEKIYEAMEITFDGVAMVNNGACRVCTITPKAQEAAAEPPKELAATVPSNPSNDRIQPENAPGSRTGCRLSLSDFTSKRWTDLSDSEKSQISSHFAYNDGSDSFTALKLPHHNTSGAVIPGCVRAAISAVGGGRTGTPMDLGGKKAQVIAHLQAHLDEINAKKEEQAPEGSLEAGRDSLEAFRDKLRSALLDAFGMEEQDGRKWGVWLVATFPDRAVFGNDEIGGLYEVLYTVSETGEILFGTPYEVRIVYQKVEAQENIMEAKEAEAKIAELTKALEKATKELADLKAENVKLKEAAAAPAAEPPKAPEKTETDKALEAANTEIATLKEKVKDLESKPNPKTPGATTTPEDGKELEAPRFRVVASRTGEIYSPE